MSLAIDVDSVTHVLLADGWHAVHEDSFDLDAYEYLHEGQILFGGGHIPLFLRRVRDGSRRVGVK